MNLEEMDDSNEIPIISSSAAVASLETIHTFLLQQDGAKEYLKLVGKIESFLGLKNEFIATDWY